MTEPWETAANPGALAEKSSTRIWRTQGLPTGGRPEPVRDRQWLGEYGG